MSAEASTSTTAGSTRGRHPIQNAIHFVDDLLWSVEAVALCVLIGALAGVSFVNVIARNFFDANFAWIGEFYQFTVIWLALIGASAATRSGRHINVDAASRLLPYKVKHAVRAALCLLGAGFAAYIVSRAGPDLDNVFGQSPSETIFGVTDYQLYRIIPLAFAVMSARFVMLALDHAFRVVGLDTSPEPSEGPVA